MQNFFRWLRLVLGWCRDIPVLRCYWISVAIVGFTVVVVGAFSWSEDAFRLAGMLLQLGGVITVVWGILKTRAEFGRTPMRSALKTWLRAFPPFRPRTTVASIDATFPPMTGEAYGYPTSGPAQDQTTFEGRLAHIENVVRQLEIAQGKTHIAVLQAEKNAQKALDTQARELSILFDGKIEATATGGLHLSGVGAVLIFFGTVFGGAGPELHRLLTL